MATRLERGSESRLDGAPYTDLPAYADTVESIAIALMEQDDADGSPRFMGDIKRARDVARAQVDSQLDAIRRRSAETQARTAEDYRRRQQDLAQARGADPEAMPYTATAGDVQRANMPPEALEDLLLREQETAGRIVRALREDKPPFEAEGDLAFLRERNASRKDMATRQAIRERRGQYYEMPDGTRIPVGREPTAADMREEEGWQDWRDETPGSDRQAKYNPAGYEEFREGVRQEIQDRARQQLETYGDGLANPTQKQLDAREARKASEERVNNSPWQVRQRRQQLAMRAGLTPAQAAEAISEKYVADGAPLSFEDQLRMRGDLSRIEARQLRKDKVAQQAELAGGQPTGGPFGTKATTTAINQLGPGWREIALLDRLTQGRVGGPTPLGVDAVGAQNAMRMLDAQALAGMNPAARGLQELQAAGAEANLPTPVRAERERAANNGVLPAQSAAGQAVLAEIADSVIGYYTTDKEFNTAVDAAVAAGVPRADAESYYRIYAQKTNVGAVGTIFGAGKGAPPATAPQAAAAAAAGPVPVVPFVPPPIPLR